MTTSQDPARRPEVGDHITFRKTMTVAEQAMFTGISGNLGGLYVDRSKARSVGLEDMAVFELVAASLLTTCLSRLAGPRYRIGSMKTDFSASITIGSTVEARAELVGTDGDALRCSLSCTANGAGIVEGEAVLVPVTGG